MGQCGGWSPRRPPPGFDCGAAEKTVEHWICASPELMQADERLTHAYRTAQAKPDGDAAIAALRAAQLRWLRQRNRCEDVACGRLRTSNAQKICRLPTGVCGCWMRRASPRCLHRTLPHINDTVGVLNIALRRAQPAAFQVELYVDPADVRPWTSGGPGVRMMCWPPDRRPKATLRGLNTPRAHGVTRFARRTRRPARLHPAALCAWQGCR